jgi:hypothetical protein
MQTHTLLERLLLLALTLCACAFPAAALAQETAGIIIAVPDRFPEADVDAVALVITEADRTVVVLRSTELNPSALEAALRIAARDSEIRVPKGASGVSVVAGFAMKREMERTRRHSLRDVIVTLQRAPESSLGGLGRGRWVQWVQRDR